MSSTFWSNFTTKLMDPNAWDWTGSGISQVSEMFAQIATYQRQAAQGTLAAIDVQKYIGGYEALHRALVKVNGEMAAQIGSLTAEEMRAFDALRAQEGQIKTAISRLKQTGLSAANIADAGTHLGAVVGALQIVNEATTGNSDDVLKVTAGVVVGMGAGALTTAALGAVVTLSGPVGWIIAAAAVTAVSYGAGKMTEAGWEKMISSDPENLRREILDLAKTAYGEESAKYIEIREQLRFSADRLGKLDGTWLEGFTELNGEQKAVLTFALFSRAVKRPADAYLADIKAIFDVGFSEETRPVRDGMIVALSAVASAADVTYGGQRVQSANGSITVDFANAPAGATRFRDHVAGLLSEQDQAGFSLTAPERVLLATQAGSLAGAGQAELLVGGTGADVVDAGAGDDVVVAGEGADRIEGKAGMDALFAGSGSDTLDGGLGGDYLYGGEGADRYDLKTGELFDVIVDSDGQGSIWIDGQQLTGGQKKAEGYWVSEDKQWGFLLSAGGDLVISRGSSLDNITIRGYETMGGTLGLTLDDSQQPPPEPQNSLMGDYAKKIEDEAYVIGDDGNYVPDGDQPGAADLITGGAENDEIDGKLGDDALLGKAGDDVVRGGEGNDVVQGGTGADTLQGGAGRDVLYGSSMGSLVYYTDPDYTYQENSQPIILGAGWGWFMSTPGPDADGMDEGYLSNTVGRDQQLDDAANMLDGGDGNDVIFAGPADDYAEGGEGKDDMRGMGGDDALFGDAGDDRIRGDSHAYVDPASVVYTGEAQHGADFIDAGEGNDIVFGQGRQDDIWGGAGDDKLFGDDRNAEETPFSTHDADYVDGEGGNDSLYGGGGADDLFGGDDNDEIWGDEYYGDGAPSALHGADYLDGELGDDSMWGGGKDDDLFGGAGNDVMYGDDPLNDRTAEADHGADYLDGEEGDDSLVGGAKADVMYGALGNDLLWGDDGGHAPGELGALDPETDGDDVMDGEEGNDTLIGEGGDDDLTGDEGDDVLHGDDVESHLAAQAHGDDILDGGAGNDLLLGDGGDDVLLGGAGDDELGGDADGLSADAHGDDFIDADEGNDTVAGGGGNDIVDGGDGDDYLVGENGDTAGTLTGDDLLDGGAGNDTLSGDAGDDLVEGGLGVDQVMGGTGDDYVAGGEGDDLVFGEAGADYLDGDSGNDQLVGGDDDDIADGGDGDDRLWGDAGNDDLWGGAGNDQAQGGEGDDFLSGELGDDKMWGQGGNDELFGDEGNDSMQGDDGDDYLDGGEGDNLLFGGVGNDTLVGTAQDAMIGGAGNDTYVIDLSVQHSSAMDGVDDADGINHLHFTGASVNQMTLTPIMQLPGWYVLDSPTGSYAIKGLMSPAYASVQVGTTSYSTGDFFGQTYAYSNDQTSSTAGAALQGGRVGDSLTTTGGNATLAGGGGDDALTGSGGNNTYRYNLGDGTDTITDTSTIDKRGTVALGAGITPEMLRLSVEGTSTMVVTFDGEAGALRVNGFNPDNAAATPAVATYRFSDGSTLTHAQLVTRGFDVSGTAADETVSGTNLADRLTGGAGYDTLRGKGGADVYTFDTGDGTDTIADGDTAAGTADLLKFGPGITPANVGALRNGNDVIFIAGSDQLTLRNYFTGGADAVEQIAFDDGTTWGQAEVLALVAAGQSQDWVINGDDGNNTLRGLGGRDTIDGRGGHDSIYGATGDDTITGGAGWDMLYGQGGSDTYLVALGADRDTIDERDGGDASGTDTVKFGAGIRRSDVTFSVSGTDLYVQGGGVDVVVAGQFSANSAANQVERFEFDDGTVVTAEEIRLQQLRASQGGDYINGFAGDDAIAGGWGRDNLYGQAGADTLDGEQGNDFVDGGDGHDIVAGGEGNDNLYGNTGDDTLAGGAGIDRLDGGAGNDVYQFGIGSGTDVVTADASGTDTIRLGAGITAANVTLYRVSSTAASDLGFSTDSLVVQINGGGDQLWVSNFFPASGTGPIESIQFADGTSWDFATIAGKAGTGGTVDTQTGTTKANTFIVDHVQDVINDPSATDVDTVNASVGYTLNDYVSNLTMQGTLNLWAASTEMPNKLTGNAGDNVLDTYNRSNQDSLVGGRGNDVYIVRAGPQRVEPNDATVTLGANITELAGEGTDTLVTGYWNVELPANLENLVLGTPNPMTNGEFYYSTTNKSDYLHRVTGNSANNLIDTTIYEDAAGGQQWAQYRNYPNFHNLLDFKIDGGAGNDTLVGGRWNDTYVVDSTGDVVVETGLTREGYDTSNDTVVTPFDTSVASIPGIENITLTGANAVAATGDARNNRLDGAGNTAANTLAGGAGNDTYVVGAGDTVVEAADGGTDGLLAVAGGPATVRLADYTNVENIRIQGDAGAIHAEGSDQANVIVGSTGNNLMWGLGGDDSMEDQALSDILYMGKNGQEVRNAADADLLDGGAGNDALSSRGGLDTLDGGAGDDSLRTYYSGRSVVVRFGLGDGHDSFAQDATTSVQVDLKQGVGPLDVTLSKANGLLSITLSDGARLDLPEANPISLRFADGMTLGSAQIDAMLRTTDRTTPTELGDLLFGSTGADAIAALGGDDAVFASDGNDTIDGGAGADTLVAGTGNDLVTGGAGNDMLGGGTGADTYRFGSGFGQDVVDDTYVGSSTPGTDDGAADSVVFDSSVASTGVSVSRQVRGTTATGLVLTLAATGDSVQLQNAYAAGNAGGVEWVKFDNGNVQWDLATVKSKVTGETGYDDSNDTLSAPIVGAKLAGLGGSDTLNGGAGNDSLDGGTGDDSMVGGAGNDTFWVSSNTDIVVEASKGGIDTVISTAEHYTLAAEVERAELASAAPVNARLSGNSLANTLVGNALDNSFFGGTGIDTMTGGAGNDIYNVDVAGDVVVELAAEGIDSVETTISYTLPNFVENASITSGATKLTLTGNALDNVLTGSGVANTLLGNAGNDTLDGGAGNDTLTGGAGDDMYVVDAAGDRITEAVGGGVDTVQTGITLAALPAEVERLLLTGGNVVNGTGNTLNNWLTGNTAANTLGGAAGFDVLVAGAGNDTLTDTAGGTAQDGGAGNDTLTAGTGNDLLAGGTGVDTLTLGGGADVIAFNFLDGQDVVNAPLAGAGQGESNDTISLGKVRLQDLWLRKEGNDLLLRVPAGGDALRLKDWYLAAGNRTVSRMQVVVDSTADYAPGSADTLRNSRIASFDFTQLVGAFDTARASNASLVDWQLTDARLLAGHQGGSDSAALGGHMAYRYAHDGGLGTVRHDNAMPQLAAAGFGGTAQDILQGVGPQAMPAMAQASSAPAPATLDAQADVAPQAQPPQSATLAALDMQAEEAPQAPPAAQLNAAPQAQPPGAGGPGHQPAVPSWANVNWERFATTAMGPAAHAQAPQLPGRVADLWAEVDAWTQLQPAVSSGELLGGDGDTPALPGIGSLASSGSGSGQRAATPGGSLQASAVRLETVDRLDMVPFA